MKLSSREADNLVADVILLRVLAASPSEAEASEAVYRRFVERVLRVAAAPAGAAYACDDAATGMLAMIGGAK